MIIDYIQSRKNNIIVSKYSEVSDHCKGLTLIPEEPLKWELNSSSTSAFIKFNGFYPINFKEIQFALEYSTNMKFLCEYSYDNINWIELPYKYFNGYYYKELSSINIDGIILKNYIKSKTFLGFNDLYSCSVIYNTEGIIPSNIPTIITGANETDILADSFSYIFTDDDGNYIYNLNPIYIKVTISNIIISNNISEILKLKTFKILGEEEIKVKDFGIISNVQNMFNGVRFENSIMPELVNKYAKMCEGSDINISTLAFINKNSISAQVINI